MKILLVHRDCYQCDRWQRRLQMPGVSTFVSATEREALKAIELMRFDLALCDWGSGKCEWSEHAEQVVRQLKSRCQAVMCIVDRQDILATNSAYAAGFNDCLYDDSSDLELAAKIEHVQHLEKVNRQLALAQKLESIGELAAGIAHEINTPIQYVGDNTRFIQNACMDLVEVLGCCKALIEATDAACDVSDATEDLRIAMDDADIEYLLGEIPVAISQTLEGVDRVASIVRAMKEFAHPGVSELTLTDLTQSIENTIMVARNEWKYVAEMETDFDPNLRAVPCVPGELNQVLLNMIVNASHAIAEAIGETPAQKGKIRITTRLAEPHAEIRVSDSGIGIPKEDLQRIFAPFFTTKAAGKGTGQGLAIVHSVVVERHGGTIDVESELGKGTTFVIRIPLKASQESDASRQDALLVDA